MNDTQRMAHSKLLEKFMVKELVSLYLFVIQSLKTSVCFYLFVIYTLESSVCSYLFVIQSLETSVYFYLFLIYPFFLLYKPLLFVCSIHLTMDQTPLLEKFTKEFIDDFCFDETEDNRRLELYHEIYGQSSRTKPRKSIFRDREAGHQRLMNDYFALNLVYPEQIFR